MRSVIGVAVSERTSFFALAPDTFDERLATLGLGEAQKKHLRRAVYVDGVHEFCAIEGLSRPVRDMLSEVFSLDRPRILRDLRSRDGTRKWLVEADPTTRGAVETVFIPRDHHGSLCVSSQVGCALACSFCRTATQKLERNLRAEEIVGQMMLAGDELGDWQHPRSERRLTNIVMMGMGEPLLNYPAVANALKIAMDPEGLAISRRRIVLSTAGIVPMIERCGRELGVELAVSLHAVDNALRDHLVPINRKWPIAELLDAVRGYLRWRKSRHILFEYVMLEGINDSDADARELTRLLRGIPSKVNLIPFNPWQRDNVRDGGGIPHQGTSGLRGRDANAELEGYRPSAPARIASFQAIIRAAGIACPIRKARGQDILAACGQLKASSKLIARQCESA